MSQTPNIILINCDDLGYGDLGCYGSSVNQTPGLDRMAREGRRFTDFYMASPVCSPSRGGMLTGCYPSRIGFGSFDGRRVLFPAPFSRTATFFSRANFDCYLHTKMLPAGPTASRQTALRQTTLRQRSVKTNSVKTNSVKTEC